MTPFRTVTARTAAIRRANVDTDQIIPARFLRKPRSAGYGTFLFADEPDLRAAIAGAGILLAGPNFGCGSSREGAVYALADAGIRAVIAPGFADIFAGNAAKNGLLLLTLSEAETAPLLIAPELTIDLPTQTIAAPGITVSFTIDPFRKRMLLEGLDEIGLTLSQAPALQAWTDRDAAARPWMVPPTAAQPRS